LEVLIGIVVGSILWALFRPKPKCPHGVRVGTLCPKCREEDKLLALEAENAQRTIEEERRRQLLQKQEQLAQAKEREFQRLREASALQKLDPYSFEMLCGSLYERMGWTARVTQRTGDGGIDAIVQRGQERKVLQCKRLSGGKVGVGPVRDLFGVIQSENAAGGILLTTTGFTTGAVDWAAGKTIELIDAAALIALLRQYFPDSGSLPDALVEHQLTQERITKRIQEIKDILNSPCPLCGKVMIIRKGKFGEFVGCSGYPACRHTRDIEPLSERRRRRGRKSKGGKRVSFRLD